MYIKAYLLLATAYTDNLGRERPGIPSGIGTQIEEVNPIYLKRSTIQVLYPLSQTIETSLEHN